MGASTIRGELPTGIEIERVCGVFLVARPGRAAGRARWTERAAGRARWTERAASDHLSDR